MADYGPGERALLESTAIALFEEALQDGGLSRDDARLTGDDETAASFALLCDLSLLSYDDDSRRWVPVDPTTVQSRVVTPLGLRGAELIAESAQWAQAFGSLAQAWRRAPGPAKGPFTGLRTDQIQPYLHTIVADAATELLTAQPQIGRGMKQLPTVLQNEVALLKRGVQLRTLYQHSARRSVETRRYVAAVTNEGAEVRTLDEFFNRLIVVDRRIAVIPGQDGPTVAMAVQEPSVVAYLVDMFERHWERARPFTDQGEALARDIAAEQRAMTIRMLIEGHADQGSAKRVGVSPRTYAGYVADLKTEFDVETRFQLGYAMGRQGVSGTESRTTHRPGKA